MKKRSLCVVAAVLVLALVFAACGNNTSPPASSPPASPPANTGGSGPAAGGNGLDDWAGGVNLTVVTNYGPQHQGLTAVRYWLDRVKEETGGKIDYTLYPGEELVKNAEMYSALKEGICDVLFQDPSYNSEIFRLTRAFVLPGIKMDNSVVATYVINDYWKFGVEQGWTELSDIKPLFNIGLNPAGFNSKVRIDSVDDFAGLSIRANGFAISPVKALGATPEALPAPDVYEGLLKNTVDAALMQYDALKNWNLAEVINYCIWAPVMNNSVHYGIMNLDTWNSLPPAAQEIITAINEESIAEAAPLFDSMGDVGLEYALELGVESYALDQATLDAMSEKMKPVVDEWFNEVNAAGLPGDAAFAKVNELAEKYNALYG